MPKINANFNAKLTTYNASTVNKQSHIILHCCFVECFKETDALVLAGKNLFVSKESVNRCSHCKKFVYGLQNLSLRNVSSTDSANLLEKIVVLVQNFWKKKITVRLV